MTTHVTDGGADQGLGGLRAIFGSPYIWGGLLTYGFYQAIPHLPQHRELVERYFCGHPLEYVEAAMFFVGASVLIGKLIQLAVERRAVEELRIDTSRTGDADESAATTLERARDSLAPARRRTLIGRRLLDIRDYIEHRPSGRGLEEHLKYLNELAAARLHDSYALLQTINWAVPIIGFLGTVMGITLAIANVTPEQLDSSLNDVTGGLAVAFDTTALALSFSVVLVFSYFFVKRAEERILSRVEDIGHRQILTLFPEETDSTSALVVAEAEAAKKFVDRTETLIQSQTRLWEESVEGLRDRWRITLSDQQQRLAESLQTGTGRALSEHAEQLATLRTEFVQAIEQVTHEMTHQLEQSGEERRRADSALIASLEAATQKIASNLEGATHRFADNMQGAAQKFAGAMDGAALKFADNMQGASQTMTDNLHQSQAASDARTERMIAESAAAVAGWQSQLEQSTRAVQSQLEMLVKQSEQLHAIQEQGTDLATLQHRLNQNLDALRAAETFQQTMHSLSAAVHLMTAHTRGNAA